MNTFTNIQPMIAFGLAIGMLGAVSAQREPLAPGVKAPDPVLVDPNTMIKNDIQEPLMDGESIAMFYRKVTGKRVIVTKAAQALEISFVQQAPLTYAEAADLLVKTCFLEGLVFVPSGPNEVKLLVAPSVRKAGGYPLVSDPTLLPDTEELVSYVMGLENIQPEEAMSIFTGVISQLDAHGSIVPVPNANALIITENSQLVRTLIAIKQRIDIPQELSTQKWIPLQHADADETAEHVRTIMDYSSQQNRQVSSGTTARTAPRSNVNNNRGTNNNNNNRNRNTSNNRSSNSGNSESGVQVIADIRTNRIFLIGRPIDVEVAESLVLGFDSPLDERNFYKQKLKFLSVSEFLNIAESAITQVSVQTSNGANSPRTNSNARITTGQNRGQVSANGSFSQNNAGGNLESTNRVDGPESIIIGKTLLVADNSNNTLIVKGPPQSIKVLKDLINEMDVVTEQVQITAIFGRYNIGDTLDFGVDFARTYQQISGDFGAAGQNRTGYPVLTDPLSLDTIASFPDTSGLSIYGQIGRHFSATLRAMENTGKFHLMARPTVFTTNNRRAVLSSGQQVAVPTNTFTQGGSGVNGSQSTNIAFRDILLELEVIPLVNSHNEVTLQISFVNNNIIGNTNIDGNDIPTIGQESIVTTVTVPNGETIVLGGLITERNESSETGVPFLMHVPGLKRLFSSVQKDVIREELVIFIQPRIVNGRVDLMGLQQENAEASQLVTDMQSGASVLPMRYADPQVQQQAEDEQRQSMRRTYQPANSTSGQSNTSSGLTTPSSNKRKSVGSRRR
ncbi:secretin N-terminal domain-containing protein [Rubritalea marina]|uniref:secretin N-terminal domain-containing protein n=1 Tax=Rubritalea marina TaxID=361055 RepID=UPI00038016E6|nr:secretin N-terminal domain-containing protein [Rubritalea marina]